MYSKSISIVFVFTLVFCGIHGNRTFAQTDNGLFREAQLPEAVPQDVSTGPPAFSRAGENAAKSIIVRKRHVQLTPRTIVGRGNRKGADFLDLNLFADIRLSAKRDRVEQRSDTDYTWFGSLEGYQNSYVIFVVGEDTVVGNIVFDAKMYQVRYAGYGAHKVQEIDTTAFEDEACKAASLTSSAPTTTTCNALVENNTVIDVLVLYTALARSNAGGTTGILQQIQLGIDETNLTYTNSGITQKVRLSHAEEVSFEESQYTSLALMRDDLVDPADSVIDNVHALRNEYAADLVSLWVEFGGGPGIGPCGIVSRIMDDVDACYLEDGFSVVARSCATGYYTFGHEMGHNMGARHDRYVDSTEGLPFNYNHGFVFPYPGGCGGFRTIMSYKDQCVDCPRIPYWSNPGIQYNGTVIGVSNSIDNRMTLNTTAQRVANFRLAHDLRVTISGFLSGNKVVPSFGRMDWDGVSGLGRYKPGKVVTLTAAPDSVSIFTGWSGEGCTGTGNCTVTMDDYSDRERSVTANFYWTGG